LAPKGGTILFPRGVFPGSTKKRITRRKRPISGLYDGEMRRLKLLAVVAQGKEWLSGKKRLTPNKRNFWIPLGDGGSLGVY